MTMEPTIREGYPPGAPLSPTEVARYHRDGYTSPFRVLDERDALALVPLFEAGPSAGIVSRIWDALRVSAIAASSAHEIPLRELPELTASAALQAFTGRSMQHYLSHPFAHLVRNTTVASAIRQVLDEDPKLWRVIPHLKKPGQGTGWHADVQEGWTSDHGRNCYAWVALTPADESTSYCSMVPTTWFDASATPVESGVWKRGHVFGPVSGVVRHDGDTFAIAPPEQERRAARMLMRPGECYLFSSRTVHAASTAVSERLGVTLRFTAASTPVFEAYGGFGGFRAGQGRHERGYRSLTWTSSHG